MRSGFKKQSPLIQKRLIAWFLKNQRDLPWRKRYDPYQIWISEIMLQQTQVKTALPYFRRWMKRLPTMEAVAKTKEETILKLWEGLGYYSRARNIQKTARILVETNKGKIHDQYKKLLKLPGIGPYSAAAIASIAFNKNIPVMDGNVLRVVARLLSYPKNIRAPHGQKTIWKWMDKILPKRSARDFNQAMMELGALICTPKNPRCRLCPVRLYCQAYSAGMVEQIPDCGPKNKKIDLRVAVGVVYNRGNVLIQKRPDAGLMPGLWEFPGGKIEPGETPQAALRRELKEELEITVKNIRPLTEIRHAYTRFNVRLYCFLCDYVSGKIRLKAATNFKWAAPERLKQFPFPSANVRLIAVLTKIGLRTKKNKN